MEVFKMHSVLVISWKISPPLAISPSSIYTSDPVVRKITYQDPVLLSSGEDEEGLKPDYYRESCPNAENIIQSGVENLYKLRPRVALALLLLVFHDCFIQGCYAPVLLDGSEGNESGKTAGSNRSLKGFDAIDIIKAAVEQACPGVVSCADILVLATRDSVVLAGVPYCNLSTGRRDSPVPLRDITEHQLPGPNFNLSQILLAFGSMGFTTRETASLLGSHSIGSMNCRFFKNRLANFSRTGRPDPSVNAEFLSLMRKTCNVTLPTMSPDQAPPALVSSAHRLLPFSFASSSPPPSLMEKFVCLPRVWRNEHGLSLLRS